MNAEIDIYGNKQSYSFQSVDIFGFLTKAKGINYWQQTAAEVYILPHVIIETIKYKWTFKYLTIECNFRVQKTPGPGQQIRQCCRMYIITIIYKKSIIIMPLFFSVTKCHKIGH